MHSDGRMHSDARDARMHSDQEFLVLIGYYDHDVSWAKRLKFPHIIYYKDQPDKEPYNARNKAKGETNPLKFIADFYDDLPKNLIHLHQYEYKFYHQGSVVDILNDPKFPERYAASNTPGYWSFNNYVLGYLEQQIPRMLNSGWWKDTMEPYFGPIQSCGDFTLGKIGCSQFVVSRERIRSLPREFYANMYSWLVNNTLDEENVGYDPVTLCRLPTKNMSHPNSNAYTSRYMEWSWELIFTAYKKTEKIGRMLANNKELRVTYGFGNYYRDVTHIFITRFIDKTTGRMIFPRGNLNSYFTDHVMNSPKTLRIEYNGMGVEINENFDISIL